VAYFKVLSRNLPGGTEGNMINLSQVRRYPSQDLNPGPLEYEAGLLTTQSRSSLRMCGDILQLLVRLHGVELH
jgi:hypothetical protein